MTTASLSPRSSRLLALTAPERLTVPWWRVTAGSLLLAGIFTLIWRGSPTYDPWAWIIWGREIVHGELVTTTGPSWKPLPMLFTIPFGLFGDLAPDLWVWVARAFALMGLVAAGQLAVRLGGRLAGVLAIVALASTPLYFAYGIQGSSEGMLVMFCCVAAVRWLDRDEHGAFWWLFAASLLRPEVWLFIALLSLRMLWQSPRRIWWIGGAGAIVIAAWLVPEKLGSGAFFRAATRANAPNPDSAAFAASPTLEVLGSMGNLLLWLPAGALIVGVVLWLWAWRARPAMLERTTLREALVLSIFALLWVGVVAAMTEDGYAGNPRYLAAPLGILVAVGLGALAWAMRLLAGRGLALVAELLVLVSLAAVVVNGAGRLPGRAEQLAGQAATRSALAEIVDRPGMRKQILACRPTTTHPLMIPPVAWTLDVHLREVGFHPPRSGTFIIGRGNGRGNAEPRVPADVTVREIAQLPELRIVQTCGVR